MVFPGWIIVVLASWTGLGGRLVEEEGRGRLGTVEERERDQIAGGLRGTGFKDRWCLLIIIIIIILVFIHINTHI